MKPQTWLKKPTYTGDEQSLPGSKSIAQLDGRMIATDGRRLHIWHDPELTAEGDTDLNIEKVDQVLGKIRSKPAVCGSFTRAHVAEIAKAAICYREDGPKNPKTRRNRLPTLTLAFNGTLDAHAKSNAIGTMRASLEDGMPWPHKRHPTSVIYRRTGKEISIMLDPGFLLDALAGMDEIIDYRIIDEGSTLHLTSGQAEAVIMGRTL